MNLKKLNLYSILKSFFSLIHKKKYFPLGKFKYLSAKKVFQFRSTKNY